MYGKLDGVETPISHAPSRQSRREFQPRDDLKGAYDPYYSGHEKRIPHFGDKTINVDLSTLYESEEERKKRIEAKRIDAEKARRKYLAGIRQDESNDKRDSIPSDMGFGKVGEEGTDEEAPDSNEQDDDPLEGFQIMEHASEKIVKRNQERAEKAIDEGRLGTIENPAPASITENEVDHIVGVDSKKGDDLDKNFQPLEERFSTAKARKLLTQVNVERDGEEYNTRIDINRINNHRQKDWLKHNGGENLIRAIWNNASFVEVMVRPHGETQVVVHESAKDGQDGRELRLDVDDFFAMFSIPDVSDGDSCFEYKKYKLNSPADEIRIKTFFEKVMVNGKKIGAKKEGTPTIIKITPWEPREVTNSEKKVLKILKTDGVPTWQENNPIGNAFDAAGYPEEVIKEEDRKKKKYWWQR